MESLKYGLLLMTIVSFLLHEANSEDVSSFTNHRDQACVDKYSRKGYQPWQEWSDHYTCHRYRCEIRDGKYFIAAVGCRKPKIPENALECHEYIEDENVEFPTCCARLRCVVEANGERIVQTRGQPGELFPDKPWKGQQNDPNQAVVGQSTALGSDSIGPNANPQQPGMFTGRAAADGGGDNGRRYVDPFPNQQISENPRKKRSPGRPVFDRTSVTDQNQGMNQYVSIQRAPQAPSRYAPGSPSLVFNQQQYNKDDIRKIEENYYNPSK